MTLQPLKTVEDSISAASSRAFYAQSLGEVDGAFEDLEDVHGYLRQKRDPYERQYGELKVAHVLRNAMLASWVISFARTRVKRGEPPPAYKM